MSIDLNWETLTSGPDGEALAESIRIFIHDKFQTVPLPRFIKSVAVHGFDFGSIPPDLELKDITNPLPDFYEQEVDEDEEDDDEDDEREAEERHGGTALRAGGANRRPPDLKEAWKGDFMHHDLASPFMGTSTPGLHGAPGLSYLQGHLGTGSHTPLAAVAGAHLGNAWTGPGLDGAAHYTSSHSRNPSQSSISVDNFPSSLNSTHSLREKSSVSTLAPTSVGTSRPPTRDTQAADSAIADDDDDDDEGIGADEYLQNTGPGQDQHTHRKRKEPRVEDVQAVFRIQYSGDIRLNLTAEILLDYPMPSFVGIPLKLNITGLSFDGVGVLANIRKRVHFCFLSPEDAVTAIGADTAEDKEATTSATKSKARFGGLLQEIKVDSEIGEQEKGKQSLKNVGKVEKFVLEQVRRIFEEEFVYPSFWTFLV